MGSFMLCTIAHRMKSRTIHRTIWRHGDEPELYPASETLEDAGKISPI